MTDNIIIGLFSGLVIASTITIINTNYFSKIQKFILVPLIIIPPAQWILALILWGYKASKINFGITQTDRIEKNLNNLNNLKDKNLLTDLEFNEKIETLNKNKIEIQIKKSKEFSSLQNLKSNGLLNNEEFNEKYEKLKVDYDIIETKTDKKQSVKNTDSKYVKILTLKDGSKLQFVNDLGYLGETIVKINDSNPKDGFYRLKDQNIALEIINGKIKMEYYFKNFKQQDGFSIEIAGNRINGITLGSSVWLNGISAPDGVYRTNLFTKITVKDGKIIAN